LLKWVKKSLIYISTSLYDAGLSSSIAEAIFLKKKIICANNSDNDFWIQRYELGLTFEDKNFNDLNDKIYSILNFEVNEDSIDISFFEKMFDYDSVMMNVETYLCKALKNDC
jgi:glycosyltransferase involved in cell wall biosynthesis